MRKNNVYAKDKERKQCCIWKRNETYDENKRKCWQCRMNKKMMKAQKKNDAKDGEGTR